MPRAMLPALVGAVLLTQTTAGTSVCQGEVRVGDTGVEIAETTKVVIERKDGGGVVEKAAVAEDGFFAVPLPSETGYQLRVVTPEGWEMDKVVVDGKECSKADVVFTLKGLVLGGEVKSARGSLPPLTVTLTNTGGSKAVHTVKTTDPNGRFAFKSGVPPGEYRVGVVATNDASLRFSSPTIQVTSGTGSVSGVEYLGLAAVVTAANFDISESKVTFKGSAVPPDGVIELGVDPDADLNHLVATHPTLTLAKTIAGSKVVLTATHATLSRRVVVDVDGNVVGIPAVSVIKGSAKIAETDANGRFTTIIELGKPAVEAVLEKKGWAFDNIKLGQDHPSVFRPVGVQICGAVQPNSLKEVEVLHGGKPVALDGGTFCVTAKTGETVKFEVSKTPKGTVLYPKKYEFRAETPKDDVIFEETLLDLSGTIECTETPCPSGITVSANSGEVERTAEVSGKGAYKFKSVPPGRYQLDVKWSSDRKPCFGEASPMSFPSYVDLTSASAKKVLKAVQAGYSQEVTLPAGVTATLKPKNLGGKKFTLTGGRTERVCLPDVGYVMVPAEGSCLGFDPVPAPFTKVVPTVYVVEGEVTRPAEIAVEKGGKLETVTADNGRYRFTAKRGETVRLTPRPVEKNVEFHPSTFEFTLPSDFRCIAGNTIPPFKGGKGFIKGGTEPPVEGADVTCLGLSAKTGPDGTFSIGPIEGNPDIVVKKSGWVFTRRRGDENVFAAERLPTILVKPTDEETGKAVSGVFVAISGPGYRHTSYSDDTGAAEFRQLEIGLKYHITLSHKEYGFERTSVVLRGGGLQTVESRAKRKAYSLLGSVQSAFSRPLHNIEVEARAEGSVLEGTTDETGRFRILGLLPSTTYTVTPRDIEWARPASVTIKMEKANVELEKPFTVQPSAGVDIRGLVQIDEKFVNMVDVQLVAAGVVLRYHPLTPLRFYEFLNVKPVAGQRFVVKVVPRATSRLVGSGSTSVDFSDSSTSLGNTFEKEVVFTGTAPAEVKGAAIRVTSPVNAVLGFILAILIVGVLAYARHRLAAALNSLVSAGESVTSKVSRRR